DGAAPSRQHPRPRDAEAISIDAEPSHELDVTRVAVIVVTRNVAGARILDPARRVSEHVPDARTPTVFGRRALDLVGGCRHPQLKIGTQRLSLETHPFLHTGLFRTRPPAFGSTSCRK